MDWLGYSHIFKALIEISKKMDVILGNFFVFLP